MKKHRWMIALFVSIAFTISIAACSTGSNHQFAVTPSAGSSAEDTAGASHTPEISAIAPSPTTEAPDLTPAETAADDNESEISDIPHYDIADLAKLGITDAQYWKINEMLFAVLNLTDQYGTHVPGYFSDANKFSRSNLLSFVYSILDDQPEVLGIDIDTDGGIISGDKLANIIHSAFNILYTPKLGDDYKGLLTYKDGNYAFEGAEGAPAEVADTYSISAMPTGDLFLEFNIVDATDQGDFYVGKGSAVIQEDKTSLFGYHLISVSKGEEAHLKFSSASASSFMQGKGSKDYRPTSAIDGKNNTAWATSKGSGEWIMLNFDQPQSISGLSLYFGNWTNDDTAMESEPPTRFRLEFSDGTTIEESTYGASENFPCYAFGREVNTTYVKITIL